MEDAISSIFAELTSADSAAREEAVLQIALLLEKHSDAPDRGEFYQRILREQLRDIVLSDGVCSAIARRLLDTAGGSTIRSDIVWAIGKARRSVALPLLAEVAGLRAADLDEGAAWELLLALSRFTLPGETGPGSARHALSERHTQRWLRHLGRADSQRNRDAASRLIEKLEAAE